MFIIDNLNVWHMILVYENTNDLQAHIILLNSALAWRKSYLSDVSATKKKNAFSVLLNVRKNKIQNE
jgi:hypothetical protein